MVFHEDSGPPHDGYIGVEDLAIGDTVFWSAPNKFLGNQSGSIGLSLSFDLSVVYKGSPNTFDGNAELYDADVVLEGNGMTLYYTVAGNPPTLNGAWTSYTVPLTAGNWTINAVGIAAPAPTPAEFASVMGALTLLEIRAEFHSGGETDYLDNVVLQSVPEASQVAMSGMVALAFAGACLGRRVAG